MDTFEILRLEIEISYLENKNIKSNTLSNEINILKRIRKEQHDIYVEKLIGEKQETQKL